jgi:transcriptional regulator with XRE-family HTH domain
MGECAPDFSARLRQVLAELNVSRQTLARELGVDRSVIGRWLSGVNQPTNHNLTRLTDVVRRHRPNVTMDFWQRPLVVSNGEMRPVKNEPPTEALRISGLHAARRPEIDANYLGLWAGLYQSTQNRGSVVLSAMHIWDSEVGLRGTFTEGRVSATGAAIAMGPRLHAILEIVPMHDRLCLFVFNGVGSPHAALMDGIYMLSAGDSTICVAASPIVLFRVGDSGDFERVGGLTGIMQRLNPMNQRNVQASMEADDPIAGLAKMIPEQVLRLVCAQVGITRADGEIDHVLRMPAHRALPGGNSGLAEMPWPANSPLVATRDSLRRLLGVT